MSLHFRIATADTIPHGSDASIDALTATGATMCALMRFTDGFSVAQNLITKDGGGNGWLLSTTTTRRMTFTHRRATTNSIYESVTNTLFPGGWHFLAATFDDAASPRGHLYIGDATSVATEPAYVTAQEGTGTINTDAANTFIVGNKSGVSNSMGGDVAFVNYYNRVLTLTELQSIQAEWLAGRSALVAAPDARLIAVYDGQAPGTRVIDLSGYGNHGAPAGASPVPHYTYSLIPGGAMHPLIGIGPWKDAWIFQAAAAGAASFIPPRRPLRFHTRSF